MVVAIVRAGGNVAGLPRPPEIAGAGQVRLADPVPGAAGRAVETIAGRAPPSRVAYAGPVRTAEAVAGTSCETTYEG